MNTLDPQTRYDPLDTEEKRKLRQKISDVLTPDVRRECPGLAIMVVSLEEYAVIRNALRKEADRKKRLRFGLDHNNCCIVCRTYMAL